MTVSEIISTIRDILAELTDNPTLEIQANTVADEVSEWDSINHVRLLIALENEFGFRFETEEAGNLANVGALADLVQAKVAT